MVRLSPTSKRSATCFLGRGPWVEPQPLKTGLLQSQDSVKVAGAAYLHSHECITREETPHLPSSVGHPLPWERALILISLPLPWGEGGPQGGG